MNTIAYVRPVAPTEFGAEETATRWALPEREDGTRNGKWQEEQKRNGGNAEEYARERAKEKERRGHSTKTKHIELVVSDYLFLTNDWFAARESARREQIGRDTEPVTRGSFCRINEFHVRSQQAVDDSGDIGAFALGYLLHKPLHLAVKVDWYVEPGVRPIELAPGSAIPACRENA